MTIVIFIAFLSVCAAVATYTTGHYILFGVSIALFILLSLLAMATEGRMLNRITKLEQEIEDLKRRL